MKMPKIGIIFICTYKNGFFLVRKVCRANFCGMVSVLRVEMYHSQLEMQSLLLWAELHDFTQDET